MPCVVFCGVEEDEAVNTLRNIASRFYYLSALAMPLWFQWQIVYVMRCRFYMEQRTPESWPWAWVGYDPDRPDGPYVCDFGRPCE
jgi:hypothetical protein